MQSALRVRAIQAKLTVNKPGDPFEQEADAVADRVMKMADVRASGDPPSIQRMCSACEAEVHRKETDGHDPVSSGVLKFNEAGRPLPDSTRSFFEPRFARSFGDVRIHTSSQAAESARELNAHAYTRGSSIVFANGQYAPETDRGRRLLAHELTHVVQQGQSGTRPMIQRACGSAVPVIPGCKPDPTIAVPSTRFLFDVNCDTFAVDPKTGLREDARLAAVAKSLTPGTTVRVVGLASFDGDARLNDKLSCIRAEKGAAVIRSSAPAGVTISSVEATGGIKPAFDPTLRAVGIDISKPLPKPKCGPDATDWFVKQVNTAMTDAAVLAVQSDMAAADALARSIGVTVNTFAEAGATSAVEAQEAKLKKFGPPPPARTGAIVGQLAAGALSQAAATSATMSHPFTTARIGRLLASAALGWRALVNHRARYDFKMHTDSMDQPHTTNCPDPGCPPGEHGTITLCPGTNPENCYESDLPGNVFYAAIGRFVGFSELTLQLGSQFAELTDLPRPGRPVITWDTPDDTAAISLGFVLPLPLTRSALCSAIGPARATLALRGGCEDCLDPTPSVIR